VSETTTALIASPERDGFLRAICTTPDDDTPRLVYADWLDEHGEHERAEFIRVQFKLLEVPECTRPNKYGKITCRCPECVLVIRWMELLGPHTTPGEYGRNDWEWFAKGLTWAAPYICTRGFVSEVTCTAADWLAHADRIAWHPEQTVECPKKYGWNTRFPPSVNPHLMCATCEGTGRVHRPCPPTAQPITVVTLTTDPEGHWIDEAGETVFVFTRGTTMVRSVREADVYEMRNRRGTFGGTPHTMVDVLETAWPGITFAREAVNP
jgi:uncharacterized protein (TIGR02996 family)